MAVKNYASFDDDDAMYTALLLFRGWEGVELSLKKIE